MSPFSFSLGSPLLLLLSPFLSFSFCLSGFLSTLNIIFPKHISLFYMFSTYFLLVQSACSPGEVRTVAKESLPPPPLPSAFAQSTYPLSSQTGLLSFVPGISILPFLSTGPPHPPTSFLFSILFPFPHFLFLGPLPSFLSFPFASCLPQVPSQDGVSSWGPRPEHPPRACEMSFMGFPSPVLTKAVPAEKTGTRTSDFSSCACFLHKWLPYNNPSSVGNWETLLGHTTNCLSMLFQAAFL